MRITKKRQLLNGCLTAVVVLSSTLTPIVANASTTNSLSAYTRIGGIDQYATAALMAQKGWASTAENVVLSAGMNYALVDALAAGPLAAKLKAPILLTDSGQSLNSFTKAELQRLKPTKVYITSGTAVIKQAVIEELKAMGITPVQLGGVDQYETSVNIAKELVHQGIAISRVVLAAGWLTPADALSIAPIAAAQEMPILTTTQGQLPASVKAYLDGLEATVTDSYIVGGTAVVSDTVKNQLPGNVTRYSGVTKYDTNVQILQGFAQEYKNDKVYVANGETLVDALAGVTLAAAKGAPVVLVNQPLEKVTKDFVKSTMSTADMIALGGEAVVPSAGMNELISNVSYATDSATVGSTDATKPAELTDNVRIIGNNVILENAKVDYSVYVQGDNITLSNLSVQGTVFVDPGDAGSATLDGVTAGNIVILSGASHSIHLNNTTAKVLTVDSKSSEVHVRSTGTTTIGNTVVRSAAILDALEGSLGQVFITRSPGQSQVVELRGIFTHPVVLDNEAQVHLGASAVLTDLITNGKASLIVDAGATVTNFYNKGNTVMITGSGANAIPTSGAIVTPPAPAPAAPSTPTTPTTPITPTTPTVPSSVTISKLRVITNPPNTLNTVNNGALIDLSELDGSWEVLGFELTADQSCIFTFKVFNVPQSISLEAGPQTVTVGDLMLGGVEVQGVNLAYFRSRYTTKTLQGQLMKDGKLAGTLTINLKF